MEQAGVAPTDAVLQATTDSSDELAAVFSNGFSHVIGVGAWDNQKQAPADFSNLTAVSIYATGVDAISNYPETVTWKLADGTVVDSTGSAWWDGTSFAAPFVTGLIAEMFAVAGHYQTAATGLIP